MEDDKREKRKGEEDMIVTPESAACSSAV